MFETYLRRACVGATICVLGGAIAAGLACSSSPRKVPSGTSGSAGATTSPTGSSTGTAGTSTTGTGGDTTAAGTAGTTGTGGDTTATGTAGAAGTTADAGAVPPADATGAAGDPNATGTAGAAGGTTGTAGAAPLGITITADAFPIPVTKYWFPSGWAGDAVTVAAFTANAAAVIKIEMMTNATTGPCSMRVTGSIGDCFKVTYTPVGQDGGAPGNASVALIPNLPMSSMANFNDPTMDPHVPAGATSISAEVAGGAGGEVVQFNLWGTDAADLFTPTLTAGQAWQKISLPLTGVTYDQERSPFGWGSSSTTPIVFYYDDVRINNN